MPCFLLWIKYISIWLNITILHVDNGSAFTWKITVCYDAKRCIYVTHVLIVATNIPCRFLKMWLEFRKLCGKINTGYIYNTKHWNSTVLSWPSLVIFPSPNNNFLTWIQLFFLSISKHVHKDFKYCQAQFK